jgi:hypothetical protein
VLGEVRAYTVRLPDGYAREPQRRHPVVYVLDGPPLDEHTAQGARPLAAAGQAPGLIEGSPFTGGAAYRARLPHDASAAARRPQPRRRLRKAPHGAAHARGSGR